jgi:hypothetical protein
MHPHPRARPALPRRTTRPTSDRASRWRRPHRCGSGLRRPPTRARSRSGQARAARPALHPCPPGTPTRFPTNRAPGGTGPSPIGRHPTRARRRRSGHPRTPPPLRPATTRPGPPAGTHYPPTRPAPASSAHPDQATTSGRPADHMPGGTTAARPTTRGPHRIQLAHRPRRLRWTPPARPGPSGPAPPSLGLRRPWGTIALPYPAGDRSPRPRRLRTRRSTRRPGGQRVDRRRHSPGAPGRPERVRADARQNDRPRQECPRHRLKPRSRRRRATRGPARSPGSRAAPVDDPARPSSALAGHERVGCGRAAPLPGARSLPAGQADPRPVETRRRHRRGASLRA